MSDVINLASRTLTVRPDLRVLVVRWHTETDMEAVKVDYWQMLEVGAAHGLSNWLLDVRRRQKAPVELSAWVNNTFYPKAVAQMAPVRLRMAVLSSPALTQQYINDPGHKREVAYALEQARPFDMAFFEEEGKAMEWLLPNGEQ